MAEPISLEAARRQMNVTDTSDDALIGSLLTAAREFIENRTGHVLVQRAFTDRFTQFGPFLQLTRQPIVAVTRVYYLDTSNAEAEYADGHYALDLTPARVYPGAGGFPTVGRYGTVGVEYVAGYAPGAEPAPLLQAVLALAASWYANREAHGNGSLVELPLSVSAIADQYRSVL